MGAADFNCLSAVLGSRRKDLPLPENVEQHRHQGHGHVRARGLGYSQSAWAVKLKIDEVANGLRGDEGVRLERLVAGTIP
jgi:hypothetical protein